MITTTEKYFWMDTCCIDRSDHIELSEAINSMFRWFENAEKCYVYLSDVTIDVEYHQENPPQIAWETALRRSRWFTRGWTLQELLAPYYVEFFSREGHKLGSKQTLAQLLQEVTGIPVDALRGKPLSNFNASELISWSRGRETRLEEDKAYSLLGILGVRMPLIYGEGEANSMKRLHEEIARRRGSCFTVPFGHNKNFVGCEPILEQLLEKIPPHANRDNCQRTVVVGLGGAGKTQIALEAAYRVRDRYPDCSIFWVPAINLTSLEVAYREIAQQLQFSGLDDQRADVKTIVKIGLSKKSAGSWLLIIDDADYLRLPNAVPVDSPEHGSTTLADFLPFSREGSILFTTRNYGMIAELDVPRENIFSVGTLNNNEATTLLRKGLRETQIRNREDVERLLGCLSNFPLAIKQASAFMASHPDVTVSQYLELFETSDDNMMDLLSLNFEDRFRYRQHAKYQNPIATTWLVSFERISQRNPQAISYLKFISLLAEKAIPLSLLPVAPDIEMLEAIRALEAYALIDKRNTPDEISMHRLVRLAVRNWLREKGEWDQWTANAVQRLAAVYPFPKHENKETWAHYLPHGHAVVDIDGAITAEGDTTLISNIAESYSVLGDYSTAERLYLRTFTLMEERLGRTHPHTLNCMENIARVMGYQGKNKEAEGLIQKMNEKVSDREYHNTPDITKNLIKALAHQERTAATNKPILESNDAASISDNSSDTEFSSSSRSSSQVSGASSQSSIFGEGDKKDIVMELATTFYQDADLTLLYSEGIESRKRNEFLRIHDSLLQDFCDNLRLETNYNNPPYIMRVLESKHQKRRISSEIWDFFVEKDTSSQFKLPDQSATRRKRLNERLRRMRINHISLPDYVPGIRIDDFREVSDHKSQNEIDGNIDDESDSENEGSDEDNEKHEIPDLQYLDRFITAFTQRPAFRAFKRSIEYLAKPPPTLDIALHSQNIKIMEYYLRNIDHTTQRKDIYPWVQELDELGLSRLAIAALLLDNRDESAGNLLSHSTRRTERLGYFAHRLGDIYSRTNEIDSLEGAVKLATLGSELTSERADRTQWPSNLGIPLENSSRTTRKMNSATAKAVIFEWDVPSLFLEQDDSVAYVEDLDNQIRTFVVLTGSDGAFEASTCAKYLEQTFGAVGSEVLNIVIEALTCFMFSNLPANERVQLKQTYTQSNNRKAAVKIERISWRYITFTSREPDFPPDFIESMTWLCESIRIISPESSQNLDGFGLLKSSMRLWSKLGTSSEGSAPITILSLEPLRQLTDVEIGRACCWKYLFKSAVISWKAMEHKGGIGLKVEYNLLVHLAAVMNYAYVENPLTKNGDKGLVAFGFYTALIPTARDPTTNSIQWHLEVNRDHVIDPEKLETIQGEWLPISDPQVFSRSTCFLGWKEYVNVKLGTSQGCYDLQWTGLPKIGKPYYLDALNINVGLSTASIFPIALIANASVSYKTRSTTKNFDREATFEEAVRNQRHHVTFVYDSGSQIAWLVPQLSWILHLCHIWWLRQRGDEKLPGPIPFADLSTNGSEAAFQALHENGETVVFRNIDLAQVFLQIFTDVMKLELEEQKRSKVYGIETMDLAIRPAKTEPRVLKLPRESYSWQYLTARADSVCFCNGLGQALEPRESVNICECNTIPNNQHLLVAHSWCVTRLLERENKNLNDLKDGRINLGDGNEWLMKVWPFDTCSHPLECNYWASTGNVMQRFSKTSIWNRETKGHVHTRPPPITGAFVLR
ncbi:hypothetical protein F4680DRAFT_439697 [Xylaria scruposa]|nr:hypothetical protein F4680DRAFT_439697 [Xylaria scruposa]